jgi:sulfur-oxidizing protein SoxY
MLKKKLTRRAFITKATVLTLSGAAALTLGWPKELLAQEPEWLINVIDPDNVSTALEQEHLMNIRLPIIAEDGSNVPIVIGMDHPMEPDHYIKTLQIVGFNDPIVSKGIYTYSPANGQAHLSTQLRMDGGDATVFVIAECSQHGRWATKASLKVSLGGC